MSLRPTMSPYKLKNFMIIILRLQHNPGSGKKERAFLVLYKETFAREI